MSFDAVAEQAQYIDDGNRNAETEYQGCQVNYLFIGRSPSAPLPAWRHAPAPVISLRGKASDLKLIVLVMLIMIMNNVNVFHPLRGVFTMNLVNLENV